MFVSPEELQARAQRYAERYGISIHFASHLGFGQDGRVWKTTDEDYVIKVFERQRAFLAELACYHRLAEHNLTEIDGFAVPKLGGWDDELQVVQMGFVSAPCIIDFGKTYIDRPPDYWHEQRAEWEQGEIERWGDKWPIVFQLIAALEYIGIYYVDPNPGNIMFEGWSVEP